MTFALQLLLASAEEGVPLWNPLSITTLVLAGVGTLGTIVLGGIGAVRAYRQDHPTVRWRFDWTGPYRHPLTGVETVRVWVSNRGNGTAHDVETRLGTDGQIRSGEAWGDAEFGEGFVFSFTRASADPDSYFRHQFKATIMVTLSWSQQPNLHRRGKKRFKLSVPHGLAYHSATGPLPRRVLNDTED